jgi:AAA ATPase domain
VSKLSRARLLRVGAATAVAAVGGAIAGYTQTLAGWTQNGWTAGIGGLVAGALVFVPSILLARTDQRRVDRQEVLADRNRVLMTLPLPNSLSNPSSAVLTTRAPSQLLVADRLATPRLWGRRRDLARLQAWVQSPNSPTVGILTGPAGVGKTRLTIQLATSLNGSWVTGKLRPRAVEVIRAIIACSEPTLVVIEANGWQPEITAILDELAELDTANPYSVKLLLVSRHRDWLTYLRSKVRADTAGLIDAAKLLPLDQVGGPKDLLRWYGEARVTFADLLGQPAPPETSHGPPTGTTFGDLLSLAYASVVTSNTGVALSTAGEVADVLAEQERLQWPEPDVMITDDLRMRIVAALILCGGVDDAEQAATAITRLPELLDAPRERIRDITRWAGRIYPGSNWFSMPSLELLTHGLAVPALRDPSSQWHGSALF